MLYLKHGGHVLADTATEGQDVTGRLDDVVGESEALSPAEDIPIGTPFDYLLGALKDKPDSHLPGDPVKVVADLNRLGAAMVDDAPPLDPAPQVHVNSTIPAVYTYFGQFIDHDLTANTDRDSKTSDITKVDQGPVPPHEVTESLRNLRRPTLDLDSVYGEGPSFGAHPSPDAGFYDGARLRIGRNTTENIPGERIPPEADLDRDLPRIGTLLDAGVITEDDLPEGLRTDPNLLTRAFIGDLRNDENLVIGQLHLSVLRFHNAVVDRIQADPQAYGFSPGQDNPAVIFERARQLTRWHYQWLVVNDYLRTVTLPGIVDKILVGGPKHYAPLRSHNGYAGELYMPLEYSVAAFRFGHTMVRGAYDHNRNFGVPAPGKTAIIPVAFFDLLFQFTGNGYQRDRTDRTKSTPSPFGGQGPTLPFNWVIEWDRFTNKSDPDEAHFARKIDTRLAPPIMEMVNEGTGAAIQDDANKPLRELLRHLARRNLLRGYLLSLPTGQAAAVEMGVPALTEAELHQGNTDAVNAALDEGGFIQHTPLWYYLLKEAEVRANGNALGELGSRMVCETIIGLLRHDPNSFLSQRGGWDPGEGVTLDNGDPIVTIRDFLAFGGLHT